MSAWISLNLFQFGMSGEKQSAPPFPMMSLSRELWRKRLDFSIAQPP